MLKAYSDEDDEDHPHQSVRILSECNVVAKLD